MPWAHGGEGCAVAHLQHEVEAQREHRKLEQRGLHLRTSQHMARDVGRRSGRRLLAPHHRGLCAVLTWLLGQEDDLRARDLLGQQARALAPKRDAAREPLVAVPDGCDSRPR